MGCNNKTWITTIMVYTLIQSIIHLIWQVIQIMLYQCVMVIENLNIIYYFNGECALSLRDNLKNSNEYGERVNYITITHLICDILWILISIVVLFTRNGKSKGSPPYGTLIFWICVAGCQIILDLVSTVFFIADEFYFLSIFSNGESVLIEPIVLAVISSRFVILLLMNVAMFFGMIVITKNLGRNTLPATIQPQHYPQYPPYQSAQQPYQPQHRTVPLKPVTPAIRNPKVPHLEGQNISRVNNWYNHYEGPQRPHTFVANDDIQIENVVQPHKWSSDYDAMRFANLPRVKGTKGPREEERAEDNLYTGQRRPPVENYEDNVYDGQRRRALENNDDIPSESGYSDNSSFIGEHTNVMVNGVPSGTLRRQLPWSYVHEPGMFPRKQHRDWPAEPPPVPVPDYSMRFPRNQRLYLDSRNTGAVSPSCSLKYDGRKTQSQQFYQ